MRYAELFEKDICDLKLGKQTKERYKKIKNFIKNIEFAKELDYLKIPNWYVLRFIDSDQYSIAFLERQITIEQKFELFKKSLSELVDTRDRRTIFMWKLKETNYDVGDYIRNYKNYTITEEEKILIKIEKDKRKKELEEKIKKSREKYGDPFGKFLKYFGINNDYEILGLKKCCTKEEIKNSYRSLAKKHHPDVGGNVEKFREINQSYERLIAKHK